MDGTIAVIAVDGFELYALSQPSSAFEITAFWFRLYVLPGASSPLSSIHYGGGEEHDLLMILYAEGSARLWDIRTGEFRRATDTEKARDTLGTSEWLEL